MSMNGTPSFNKKDYEMIPDSIRYPESNRNLAKLSRPSESTSKYSSNKATDSSRQIRLNTTSEQKRYNHRDDFERDLFDFEFPHFEFLQLSGSAPDPEH